MTAGESYKFKVSAFNSVGESLLTDSIMIIASDLPEKPVNPPILISSTQSTISITLTAIPPASNGGSPITGYIVMIDDGLGGAFS